MTEESEGNMSQPIRPVWPELKKEVDEKVEKVLALQAKQLDAMLSLMQKFEKIEDYLLGKIKEERRPPEAA